LSVVIAQKGEARQPIAAIENDNLKQLIQAPVCAFWVEREAVAA